MCLSYNGCYASLWQSSFGTLLALYNTLLPQLLLPFMSQQQTSRPTDNYITVRIHKSIFSTVRNLVLCAFKVTRDTHKPLGSNSIPFVDIDQVFQVVSSQEEQDRRINEALLASFGDLTLTPLSSNTSTPTVKAEAPETRRRSTRNRRTHTATAQCTTPNCLHHQ